MKFFIHNPNKIYFTKIEKLFELSLIDLGHQKVDVSLAEYIFCIQRYDPNFNINDGRKYILIQTEDWKTKPGANKSLYFKKNILQENNRIWGFDVNNINEEYIYLGYHPFLDLTKENFIINKEIGFLGGLKNRRLELHKICKNKFISVREWDYLQAIRKLREFKINIHIHSFEETKFTPWDRIIKFLNNKIFFILEECYIPNELSLVPMFKFENYDAVINKYLKNEKLRLEISKETYNIWKNKFDMRNFLEKKLEIK